MSTTTTKTASKNGNSTNATPKSRTRKVSTTKLKNDVRHLAEDTKKFAAQKASSIADTTKEAVEDAKSTVVDVTHKGQDLASREYDRCMEGIKKNPLAAVGIAAGVGLLAGMALLAGGRKS